MNIHSKRPSRRNLREGMEAVAGLLNRVIIGLFLDSYQTSVNKVLVYKRLPVTFHSV